jgi:hypothetical protein
MVCLTGCAAIVLLKAAGAGVELEIVVSFVREEKCMFNRVWHLL